MPPQYPFLHVIKDAEKPKLARVHIGGSAENLGDEVPHRFLTALSDCAPFAEGSSRRELAEAIASPANPLTARVMVNRIWHHHFGAGLVRTPSDFGFMGDRPSNPALLDYLAARFVESGWSLKALHREILLSAAYQAGGQRTAQNETIDPENRLLWRANLRRLDAEALRDSLLAASGELDLEMGGPPVPLSEAANRRRTVYGFVSRRKLDGTLALFDFPNPNQTIDRRSITITPPQQLFLLNSPFVMDRAARLADSVADLPAAGAVRQLYRAIYGRAPAGPELELGVSYLGSASRAEYAQALFNSNEFVLVD